MRIAKTIPPYLAGALKFCGERDHTSYETAATALKQHWEAYAATGDPRVPRTTASSRSAAARSDKVPAAVAERPAEATDRQLVNAANQAVENAIALLQEAMRRYEGEVEEKVSSSALRTLEDVVAQLRARSD